MAESQGESETPTVTTTPTSSSGGSRPATQQRSSQLQLKRVLQKMAFDEQVALLTPAHSVQLEGGGGGGTEHVHQQAAQGIASGGGALPHAEQVQQSFGSHDISGIQSHSGSAAVQASQAMGAQAYATGNHVAFGSTPDLHTVAHEAAHVVQQQQGVSLAGGVGQVGDPYEQHADKVADAVVKGESAEPILNQMTGGGGGGNGATQQRSKVQRRAIQRTVQREETPPNSPPGGNGVPGGPALNNTSTAPVAPAVDPAVESQNRKQEVAGVVTPPIVQGAQDPPMTVNPNTGVAENMKSDSRDPIMLKDKVITLTNAYLALQVPPTTPAEKQAKLEEIKSTFETLRAAMKTARGEDEPLVRMRVDFEKYLGVKATGEWSQGTDCLNKMVGTAKSMIAAENGGAVAGAGSIEQQLAALPQNTKDAIAGKIGAPVNIGFAGVVGKTFSDIITALDSGSHVQKAQGLIGFTDGYLIPGLLKGSGAVFEQAKAKLAAIKSEIDLVTLVQQANALAPDDKAQKALLLTSPAFRAKLAELGIEAKENNAEREKDKQDATGDSNAKLNKDALVGVMDSKIPEQPIEVCTEQQLDFIAGEVNPTNFAGYSFVDYGKQRGKEAKLAYLLGVGIKTTRPKGVGTDREGKPLKPAAVDASSTVPGANGITTTPKATDPVVTAMPQIAQQNYAYIEGKLENIVDPKSSWIMNANEALAPLKAGISGTTARFVGAANMLGGDMNGATVAMLGHLQAIEAHSFWEIVDAAGLGMSAGKYVPFAPNNSGMESAAGDFINQNGYAELGPMDNQRAKQALLGTLPPGAN